MTRRTILLICIYFFYPLQKKNNYTASSASCETLNICVYSISVLYTPLWLRRAQQKGAQCGAYVSNVSQK